VPGCLDTISGSGFYFLPGGSLDPCPPSPIVVIPPPPPPLPTCTLTVYSRPLNYDVVRHGPDLHGYLDLTSPLGILIFEGLHIGSLIKAGGGPLGVFDPNKPSQDTNDGS